MDDSKLEKAIQYTKSGSIHLAKPLLLGIVREDPTNDEAWLYLALCENDKQQKKNYLEVAKKINPLSVPIRKYYQESVSNNKYRGNSSDAMLLQETVDSLVLGGEVLISPDQAEFGRKTESIEEDEIYDNEDLILNLDRETREKEKNSDNKVKSIESSKTNLVTFSKAIYLTGTIIHYFDQPCCLQQKDEIGIESFACDECEHYAPSDCPFYDDECLFEDVLSVFRIIEKFQFYRASRSLEVATIAYKELRAHGRPLHFSVIANIVIGRNPRLNISDQEVYEFMLMYPEMIERVGEGVYQAKGR